MPIPTVFNEVKGKEVATEILNACLQKGEQNGVLVRKQRIASFISNPISSFYIIQVNISYLFLPIYMK